MAVSLYGLRAKIAAAAVVKGIAVRVAKLPGGASFVQRGARKLSGNNTAGENSGNQQQDDATGSYRGLLAQMLEASTTAATVNEKLHGPDTVVDPIAGLIPGTTPALPADTSTWAYARAVFDSGETERGLELMTQQAESHPTSARLNTLAAACRRPQVGNLDAAAEFYARALELNPSDLRAVEGTIHTVIRSQADFAKIRPAVETLLPSRGPLQREGHIWAVVSPLFEPKEPAPAQVKIAVVVLKNNQEHLRKANQLLLEALIARLQFLGEFVAAFSLRETMAQNRIDELHGIPLESATWLKHLLGAYAYRQEKYRDEQYRAARTAQRPLLDTPDPVSRLQVKKLQADVALLTGDHLPLVKHVEARAAERPLAGEELARDLIKGKRVAIVGPADTGENLGELIDSYDLVVRPRHQPEFVAAHPQRLGHRTDIAYYAGKDYRGVEDELQAAITARELQQVVVRPFAAGYITEPPAWLRFSRCEFGLYFRGAPMAPQRMIYDLLTFNPAEIALFNLDFYSGSQALAAGYRENAAGFGPGSPLNDVVMVHDLLGEFRFTRAFMGTGIVTAHGAAADTLNLSETEYLRRLEEQSPLGR